MKNNMKNISLIFLIPAILMLLSFSLSAQQKENPDTKALSKDEKKAMKLLKKGEEERKRMEVLYLYKSIAESRSWVIEAHTVYNKAGQGFPMNPTTNFVSVRGDETTFQLAFNGISGWNGVGGITLEGHISKYNVTENTNTLTVTIMAMGPGMGPIDLLITVSPDGNGRATVSGNWGDRITFAGRFVPMEDSSIYKGTPSY
jgi:hypothetical protein